MRLPPPTGSCTSMFFIEDAVHMRGRNKGFTLIEVTLALALLSFGLILSFQTKTADLQIEHARVGGQTLLQYSNAVRKWILMNPGQETDQVGAQWLKPTSCGGLSTVEFLPCSFPTVTLTTPLTTGSMTFSTSIKVAGTGAEQSTTATITATPFKVRDATGLKARSDLSGVVALTVAAGGSGSNEPLYSSTTLTVSTAPNTGFITITARARPFDDAWLRLDGKNSMHEALVMNGSSLATRMVLGVNRIQALAGEALRLGSSATKSSTMVPVIGSGVIVDADIEHLGRIYARDGVLSNGGFTSADNALIVKNANLSVKTGKALSTRFVDSDDNSYYVTPAAQTRINQAEVAGRVVVDAEAVFKGVVVNGTACPVNGAIAANSTYDLMSCKDFKWSKISDPPKMYRFTFTSNSTWVVPAGVTSAQISMAGGGGSGLGWRAASKQNGGNSGGYIYNEPVTVVPGETMTIEVGKGAISFVPTNPSTNTTVAGGQYYWYQPPVGDAGHTGYNGTSSKVISPSMGTILECTGGSGAALSGIDSITGPTMPGGLPGFLSGSGVPSIPTPTPIADGPWSAYAAAGACGPNNKGRGNNGAEVYYTAGGTVRGGISPFGYGSGGDTIVDKWYVTYDTVGLIIQPQPGRDGIVYIDIMY